MLVFFLSWASVPVLSQTQDSYEYDREFTWGINKNSAGGLIGGFTFKKAKRIRPNQFETFGLEIMNVKNPAEVRIPSGTGSMFIFGKTNYLYAFRFQYGCDFVLFTKAPQQGVEIKAVVAAGPSLGVVAPYYIERTINNSVFNTVHEQYDPKNPNHYVDKILGTGYLFEGLGKSKIELGGNIKFGLNFELGVVKSQVTGFEVGVLLDAYFNEIILMPTATNRAVFPTAYFTLFYGSRK
ncbi:MAG: hypothetical protein ACKO13_02765 [Cytophagales bacterium]